MYILKCNSNRKYLYQGLNITNKFFFLLNGLGCHWLTKYTCLGAQSTQHIICVFTIPSHVSFSHHVSLLYPLLSPLHLAVTTLINFFKSILKTKIFSDQILPFLHLKIFLCSLLFLAIMEIQTIIIIIPIVFIVAKLVCNSALVSRCTTQQFDLCMCYNHHSNSSFPSPILPTPHLPSSLLTIHLFCFCEFYSFVLLLRFYI